MIHLYTFQHWPDIETAFDRTGSYTPSWSIARARSIAENGGADRRNGLSPAYRWMMREMAYQGLPRPNPDATPLWAWACWTDTRKRIRYRPDRRCQGFRNQFDGLELLHLRVDESRILCTDFLQYHCVINRWPCAPPEPEHGRTTNTTNGWTSIGMIRPKRKRSNTGGT